MSSPRCAFFGHLCNHGCSCEDLQDHPPAGPFCYILHLIHHSQGILDAFLELLSESSCRPRHVALSLLCTPLIETLQVLLVDHVVLLLVVVDVRDRLPVLLQHVVDGHHVLLGHDLVLRNLRAALSHIRSTPTGELSLCRIAP